MGAQVQVGEGFLYLPTVQGGTMGNAGQGADVQVLMRVVGLERWSKVPK